MTLTKSRLCQAVNQLHLLNGNNNSSLQQIPSGFEVGKAEDSGNQLPVLPLIVDPTLFRIPSLNNSKNNNSDNQLQSRA